jgi:hypothetical protein
MDIASNKVFVVTVTLNMTCNFHLQALYIYLEILLFLLFHMKIVRRVEHIIPTVRLVFIQPSQQRLFRAEHNAFLARSL